MLKAHLTKHAFICKQVELFLSIIPTAGKLWISPPWTQSVLQSRDEMRFLISQSVSLPCWGQGDTLHGQVGAKEFQRGPAPGWPWPFDLLRVLNEKASSGIPDLLIKQRAEHNVCRFCHPRGHADYPCTIPPRAHLTIILFFFLLWMSVNYNPETIAGKVTSLGKHIEKLAGWSNCTFFLPSPEQNSFCLTNLIKISKASSLQIANL